MARDGTSRYRYTPKFTDLDGTVIDVGYSWYGSRTPLRYIAARDNEVYVVQAGDTLQNLAARKFAGYEHAALLWWIIAEFQPTPITDPTLRLEPGSLLVIPASRLVAAMLNTNPGSTERIDG
jgi:hypothetical protein